MNNLLSFLASLVTAFLLEVMLLILTSCNTNLDTNKTINKIETKPLPRSTIRLIPNTIQVSTLVDLPKTQLGQVSYYRRLSSDSAIVISNRSLYLVINDTIHSNILKLGKGPGEYQSACSFYVLADTLVILDKTQKVIFYNLRNGNLIREYFNPKLTWAKSICATPDGAILFGNMSDPDNLPDKKLLYTLDIYNKNSPASFLQLEQKDIELPRLKVPVKPIFYNNITAVNDLIVITYLLSPYVVIYNTKAHIFTKLHLQVQIQNFEQASEENDDKIFAQSDIVNDIYCLSDMFGAVVLKPSIKKNDQRIQCIQWYTYSGQSIGEIELEIENYGFQPRIVDVSKDTITLLTLDNSSNTKFPYKILRQKYAINQSH